MPSRARPNDRSLPDVFIAPLPDFVRARNAYAARLKEEGRTSEAAEVQRLRKPTPAVWSINQLARRQPDKIRELVAAVEALRRAHLKEAGELAQATERHRTILQDLLDSSKSILGTAGLRASPDVLRRLANTLSGVVADPGTRSELLQGRLTEEREAPGFEVFAGDRKPLRPPGPKIAPRPSDGTAAREARRRAQADVRAQEDRARVLARAAARQQRAFEAAAAAAARARQRLIDLDRRAAEQQRAAEQAAQAAQHARQEAQRAADKARATY
jgi:hypothetical protein